MEETQCFIKFNPLTSEADIDYPFQLEECFPPFVKFLLEIDLRPPESFNPHIQE